MMAVLHSRIYDGMMKQTLRGLDADGQRGAGVASKAAIEATGRHDMDIPAGAAPSFTFTSRPQIWACQSSIRQGGMSTLVSGKRASNIVSCLVTI